MAMKPSRREPDGIGDTHVDDSYRFYGKPDKSYYIVGDPLTSTNEIRKPHRWQVQSAALRAKDRYPPKRLSLKWPLILFMLFCLGYFAFELIF